MIGSATRARREVRKHRRGFNKVRDNMAEYFLRDNRRAMGYSFKGAILDIDAIAKAALSNEDNTQLIADQLLIDEEDRREAEEMFLD